MYLGRRAEKGNPPGPLRPGLSDRTRVRNRDFDLPRKDGETADGSFQIAGVWPEKISEKEEAELFAPSGTRIISYQE